VDREGLWYKVLSSHYGEERGRIKEGEGMDLPGGGRL
jgi:hypothetical protein